MPTVELAGRGTVAYQWSGSGPETVVLLNGSIFNYRQWEMHPLPVLRRTLGRGFRFLRYDYIGIGRSSARQTPMRMLDLADELRDLLDALGVEQAHLLGVSQGSLVGQAFLIRHRARARSFCGLGNPHVLSSHMESTFALLQARIAALEGMRELWPQRVNRRNYARIFERVYAPAIFTQPDRPGWLRAFIVRQMAYPALAGTFIQTMVDLFRYYTSGITEEAPVFAEGLPQVRGLPLLLLNGTADRTTPVEMSRELARLWPEAELVEFEGVTHMGPLLSRRDARGVFGRYAEFVKRET